MFSMVDYKPPTYNKDEYIYPDWAILMGWMIAVTSLGAIPVCGIVELATSRAKSLKEVGYR